MGNKVVNNRDQEIVSVFRKMKIETEEKRQSILSAGKLPNSENRRERIIRKLISGSSRTSDENKG